jgi:hypothetical protein
VIDRAVSLAPLTIRVQIADTELRTRTLFREVNARIRAISQGFGIETGTVQVLCECGVDGCLQRLEVPVGVFAELGLEVEQRRFVVAPGHGRPGRDRLVLETADYRLVAVTA